MKDKVELKFRLESLQVERFLGVFTKYSVNTKHVEGCSLCYCRKLSHFLHGTNSY